MIYKEYPDCLKPYVVVCNTGTGFMEDPYVEQNVAYETDYIDDAKIWAARMDIVDNTPEQVKSSFLSNTYTVNINISCDEGKKLHESFIKEFETRLKNGLVNDRYIITQVGGITFYTDKYNPFNL